jgi:hypothetical protein
MDPSSTDELRRRIAALETDLQTVHAAREEAEDNLAKHRIEQKNAEHARHVSFVMSASSVSCYYDD